MLFQDLGARKVVADFSGGFLSSDGGALLFQQLDAGLGISRTLAACFRDERDPTRVEHSIEELIRQRLFALSLGYEDLNDHSRLRHDPLLAAVIGKEEPLGSGRRLEKDRGSACASPSTLNRLELGAQFSDRYRKIQADPRQVEAAVLELGVRCLPKDQELFVLDFDATDTPLHGRQEGRFFHGYYDSYCYLPLFCFVGDVPVWAQLRTSDTDASAGTCEALEKIVAAIRRRFPKAKIVVRADSGFSREAIFAWCERQKDVYYLIGMARNARLETLVAPALMRAQERLCLTGVPCREFLESECSTLNSWSCARRMLCKAEALAGMAPEGSTTGPRRLPPAPFRASATARWRRSCPRRDQAGRSWRGGQRSSGLCGGTNAAKKPRYPGWAPPRTRGRHEGKTPNGGRAEPRCASHPAGLGCIHALVRPLRKPDCCTHRRSDCEKKDPDC